MKLEPIGKIEDPKSLDLDPVIIPVCGVSRKKKENVCEEFKFRPTLPWGNTFALIESAEGGRVAMAGNTVKWLRNCLIDDDERERFQEFLTHPDIEVEQETVEKIYETIAEVYSERPTLPRTDSIGTGGSTGETSTGDSDGKASTSRAKRSRKA